MSIVGGDKVVTDTDGLPGESFLIVASASDSDGSIASSTWKINGSTVGTGTFTTLSLSDGNYTVTFEATDNDGASSSSSALVTVVAPAANVAPVVSIVGGNRTIADSDGETGETLTISATASDSDGTISATVWKLGSTTVATGTVATISLSDGVHTVTFEATDDDGGVGSTSVVLTVSAATTSAIPAYDRDEYLPDWDDADNDCINTRHEVLILESAIPVTMNASGCSVVAGLWNDPFTGQSFTDPSDVDVDHLVALQEAHDSGGYLWTTEQKQAFANDLLRADALRAIDDGTNSSKSARDPAEWLPPDSSFHCEYVRDWVEIKNDYGLTFDDAERTVIESVLGADISAADRPKLTGVRQQPGDSSAVFRLGMAKNGECAFSQAASAGDTVNVTVSITPEVAHLVQLADVFLVASLNGGLYSIDSIGGLNPFDGTTASLVPFIQSHEIVESFEFTLINGIINDPIDVSIYVGYSTKGGEFIYTPSAFELIID